MVNELKPVKVAVFFPSDVEVSFDRAYWYLENAIRGHWMSFAHDNDPIRGMARASVSVSSLSANSRPTAPVGGLERSKTARETACEVVDAIHGYTCEFAPDYDYHVSQYNLAETIINDLLSVTRSQSEAIIAAEREAQQRLMDIIEEANTEIESSEVEKVRLENRILVLEADNAALTARVKEYFNAQSAYNEATRPGGGFGHPKTLKANDPIVIRYREARAALEASKP